MQVNEEPDIFVKSCSKCHNSMVLRKLQNQKLMIGCLGYPNCKEALFIPGFVTSLKLLDIPCNFCR
jgi:DNA topoisomerase-3